MPQFSRRDFLRGGAGLGATALSISTAQAMPNLARPSADPETLARDEAFWGRVAAKYDVTDSHTNLENGYWGIMAKPVLAEYQRLSAWVNHRNTPWARFELGEVYSGLRERVAAFLNVGADEIALTRGATEALQALIGSYNRLSPGDTVLYADLDYREMKTAMAWLADRRGVQPVKVTFPEPTRDKQLTEQDILDFYEQALDANPGTKLLLLTHLNNLTGMIIPVSKIAAMARERGIDVILDAAHSVGQVDFDIAAMGCDFVGVNLHKWVGAPIGCGVMFIRRDRVTGIDSYMGRSPGSDKVTDRIDTGTSNFAAHLAIPATFDFHEQIGTAVKEARLRYLRNLWVEEARKLPGVTVLSPDAPAMVAALTSFRLDGVTSTADNRALMRRLADEFGLLTTQRHGPAAGDCIRVTPSFYNRPDDCMKLVRALQAITAS